MDTIMVIWLMSHNSAQEPNQRHICPAVFESEMIRDYPLESTSAAQTPSLCSDRMVWFLKGLALTSILAVALVLTFDRCVWCVVGIAAFSGLTMNCVPMMPLIFMLSMLTLIMHAVDYQKASIRVEIPLQDMIYVPTWDDFHRYVKVAHNANGGQQ